MGLFGHHDENKDDAAAAQNAGQAPVDPGAAMGQTPTPGVGDASMPQPGADAGAGSAAPQGDDTSMGGTTPPTVDAGAGTPGADAGAGMAPEGPAAGETPETGAAGGMGAPATPEAGAPAEGEDEETPKV